MFAWNPIGRGRRIERSLDRIDEELRLSREQHREAMAEFRALAEEHRGFAERMAAAHAAQVAESHEFLREITREVRAVGTEQVRVLQRLVASVDDLREESRAQRQALLRLIDRLGPWPGGATA